MPLSWKREVVRHLRFAPTAVAALLLPLSASAAVVFQHHGASDPTGEGWAQTGPLGGAGPIAEGPVVNDSGYDAWAVDDDSTSNGSYLYFTQTPTDTQISDAAALGWALRSRLRVVDVPDTAATILDASVSLEYADGARRYTLVFGSDTDGDPIVTLITGQSTGTSHTLEGTGGGYHLYELVFDPVAGSADLFVDGVEQISDYGGHTHQAGVKRVSFGGASSPDTGHGRYNLVEFTVFSEAVPSLSPPAILVLSSGLLAIGARRLGRGAR